MFVHNITANLIIRAFFSKKFLKPYKYAYFEKNVVFQLSFISIKQIPNQSALLLPYPISLSNLQILHSRNSTTTPNSQKTVNPHPVTFLQQSNNLKQIHYRTNNTPTNLTTNNNPIYHITKKSK